MKIVTRKGWGARSATLPTNITPTGGVTFHYVGATQVHDSHSQCAGRVKGIQNFHIDGNGWTDIAYSLLICQHGYVYIGRGTGRRTAANGTNNGNQFWYAVCFLIGGSQNPTAEAVQAGRDAVAYLRAQGGAGRGINGHRDHLATSCPGTPVYSLVQSGALEPGTSGGNPGTPGARPVLRRGSTGPAVRELQELLIALGYDLGQWGADGDFGADTETAVKAFQVANGLDDDGVVGPDTWAALLPSPEKDLLDVADLREFRKDTSDLQTLPARDWRAVHFGGGDYSLAFAGEDYNASVGIALVITAPEGVDVRGQEFQARFAEYRPNPDTGPGQPNWVRSRALPINSPVHDGGKLHFTQSWNGQLPKDRRLRFEVLSFLDNCTVQVEQAVASVHYAK